MAPTTWPEWQPTSVTDGRTGQVHSMNGVAQGTRVAHGAAVDPRVTGTSEAQAMTGAGRLSLRDSETARPGWLPRDLDASCGDLAGLSR
jgi:hypothetical protein